MQQAGYREVPLYARDGSISAYALVDDTDYHLVAETRWHIGSNGYARQGTSRHLVLMHRLILGLAPGDGRKADHINRNKLDNRRANLRIVTHAENMQNRAASAGSTSRFRAVGWETEKRSWRARIVVHHQRHHLGYFSTEIEAALAVDAWRRENVSFYQPDPELVRVLSLIEDRKAA